MQQIRVTLSPFTVRSGSLQVSHVEAGLSEGLDQGQPVLVHDVASGLHRTAIVADVHFELADTTYRLELGSAITAEEAAEWLLPADELPVDRVTSRDIVELLGALRRNRRDVGEALADFV